MTGSYPANLTFTYPARVASIRDKNVYIDIDLGFRYWNQMQEVWMSEFDRKLIRPKDIILVEICKVNNSYKATLIDNYGQ